MHGCCAVSSYLVCLFAVKGFDEYNEIDEDDVDACMVLSRK